MAKAKSDTEFKDAKGNTHKHFADGRSEIYVGGFVVDQAYIEITDVADTAVNRRRFLPSFPATVEDTLIVRDDPEVAVPGIDDLDEEL